MNKILNIIKKYYPLIFFVLVLLLSILLFQTCSTLNTERTNNNKQEKLYTQNIKAMTDSITKTFNKKLDAYEYTKDSYVVNKLSELEQYNKSLESDLKKIKGDVLSAINAKVQGDLGGITASNDLEVLDSVNKHYALKFTTNYVDSGFQQTIVGRSKFYAIPNEKTKEWTIKPDITVLDTNLTSIKVTYGFKELKDKYQIFAISKSDKIQVTDLTGGYFIDKQIQKPIKSKKWGIGPYIGAGLNSDTKFNPTFGYSIGIGVHYNIIQW